MENRFKIILDKGNKVRQSRHSADRVDRCFETKLLAASSQIYKDKPLDLEPWHILAQVDRNFL